MKSFLQHITEAGILHKMRGDQQAETNAIAASLDPMASPAEKRAANATARIARADLKRESDRRAGRVLRRAQTEAEARVPFPTVGGIHATIERMERVNDMALGFAKQMADAEKPGFVREIKR